MISPVFVTQNSMPIASIQQNTDSQGALQSQMAHVNVEKQEQLQRQAVVQKEEAVFYQQNHDAKEEGRNKYANLYSKKKKEDGDKDKKDDSVNRVNFDIKL